MMYISIVEFILAIIAFWVAGVFVGMGLGGFIERYLRDKKELKDFRDKLKKG